MLTLTDAAADDLRAAIEQELGDRAFEELRVHTVHGFCARLLRDEALEARLDPFVATIAPADRLALLLERIDDLTLGHHDFRGNPAAMLGGVIARIDRLKDEMVSAADYARWADSLPAGEPRAEREREFAALYAAHERLLAEAGALDFGDLVLHAHRLLEGKPHVRARVAARHRHVLVDEYQDLDLAQARVVELLAREHGNLVAFADDDQSVRRFRGAAARTLSRFAERPPRRADRAARALAALPAGDPRRRARRGRAQRRADPQAAARRARRRGRASGAARTSARRRRARPPPIERLVREGVAPERIGVLVRSVRNEGQAVAVALEERAHPLPPGRRRRVLRPRRGP